MLMSIGDAVLRGAAGVGCLILAACAATDDRNVSPEQRAAMARERYSAQPAGSLETPQQRYDESPASRGGQVP